MSIASPTTTQGNSSNSLTTLLQSFTRNRSLSPVVRRLVELCVQRHNNRDAAPTTDAEQIHYLRKAIHSLVKKLKRPGKIEELERAILQKNANTRCVTIPRSVDGRLQVQQRESNPVVTYCRLWRWPDLSNHNELKPVVHCPNAFHYRRDEICINPFHYERVLVTYSVYVPRLPPEAICDIPDLRSQSMNDMMPNQIPGNTTYQSILDQQQSPPSSASYQLSPGSISSQVSLLSPFGGIGSDESNGVSCEVQQSTLMDFDMAQPISNGASNTFLEAIIPHIPQFIPTKPFQYPLATGEQVPFEEPYEWCHIGYYEMSNRVGERFCATQQQVIIDGFTGSLIGERFCLGGLTNIHRTLEIDKARRHIGRGVKLIRIGGDVYAECISNNSVFVQSQITNQHWNWHPATVCKKSSSSVPMKIFDLEYFTQILVGTVEKGYEAVYNLMHMCIVRMSFVKGWGADYRRQAVTCTPCWVEIHLDGPLKWLDNVLLTMRGPGQLINSRS